MRPSSYRQLGYLWLLSAGLVLWILFAVGESRLLSILERPLLGHLQAVMDESFFSSSDDLPNDQQALRRLGTQVNEHLDDLIAYQWYAPWKHCSVRLAEIDGAPVTSGRETWPLELTLVRKNIERPVRVDVDCRRNWPLAGALALLLGVLLTILYRWAPTPLAAAQRRWLTQLVGQGYQDEEAFEVVSAHTGSALALNRAQQAYVERVHVVADKNIADTLQVATDRRVASLAPEGIPWLVYGLQRELSLSDALDLARQSDHLLIDLPGMKMQIRGLDMPLSGTPLFYYAWYARARMEGEGWITNPASNRPDVAVGRDLADLMERYGGHARAINDLEQAGLKARTLDQNRSKIKDELIAQLGDELAAPYLFEAQKSDEELHKRYRLSLNAAAITLVT